MSAHDGSFALELIGIGNMGTTDSVLSYGMLLLLCLLCEISMYRDGKKSTAAQTRSGGRCGGVLL